MARGGQGSAKLLLAAKPASPKKAIAADSVRNVNRPKNQFGSDP